MVSVTNWLAWPKGEGQNYSGIDLGDGRMLGAEDVLESHYRRISRKTTDPVRMQNVSVQVEDDLNASIAVLAPTLAPLTEVAEEVADALPNVQPTQVFRHNLHRALEQTHRQHAAQRALGTRSPALTGKRLISSNEWQIVVVAGLCLLFALWVGLLRRSKTTDEVNTA